MGSEFDQDNLVGSFVAEASDGMTALTKALRPTDTSVPTPQHVQEQYIVAHRIHGAAALYGYSGVAQLSERLETLLEQALNIPDAEWKIVQGIQSLVQSIGHGGAEDGGVVERCLAPSEGLLPGTSSAASPEPLAYSVSQAYVIPVEVLSYFVPEAEEYLNTIDGLIQALRANVNDEDANNRLFRTAHTLKGSAYTVGFQVIGDIAHPMEGCIVAVLEKRVQLSGNLLEVIA